MSTAETKNFLRAMAASLTAAVRRSTFDPAPVRAVGEYLVTTHFVGPNALGITVGLLSEHLATTGAPAHRTAAILAALTSGYTTARTHAILEQQETLRQVWIQNHSPAAANPEASLRAAAFVATTTAMCLVDNVGRIVDPNPAWCDLFGVTVRDCVGRRITDLVDTRYTGRVGEARAAVAEGVRSHATVDVRCWHPQGHALCLRLDLAPVSRPGEGPDPGDASGLVLATAYNATPERDLMTLLERQEERDGLTYLLNRSTLLRCLDELLEPPHTDIGLICLRIPHLGLVNLDGQAAGDAVLSDTADLVQRTVGDTALAARIGGALFAVALPDAEPAEVSALVGTLEGLLAPREGFVRHGAPRVPSVVGVHSPTDGATPDTLLDAAERLLRTVRNTDHTR